MKVTKLFSVVCSKPKFESCKKKEEKSMGSFDKNGIKNRMT